MKKVLLSLAVAMALPLSAQAWTPQNDINVIVAYKAGSGTDTGARLLSSQAEKFIGKTLIINNLPGADGKIGWTRFKPSPTATRSALSICRPLRLWPLKMVLPLRPPKLFRSLTT